MMKKPKAALKKRTAPKPYKHDVSVCLQKIRKSAKEADPSITAIEFELSSIQRFGSKPQRYATGQAIVIYRTNKNGREVRKKSFFRHDFCPYCGKRF